MGDSRRYEWFERYSMAKYVKEMNMNYEMTFDFTFLDDDAENKCGKWNPGGTWMTKNGRTHVDKSFIVRCA